MSCLVIAEHDNAVLKGPTLNTIAAAQKIGGEIHVLVAGQGCSAVAEAVARVPGVRSGIKPKTGDERSIHIRGRNVQKSPRTLAVEQRASAPL